MKIKTNLSPSKLRGIAKGLNKAADAQLKDSFKPENSAEAELVDEIDTWLADMLDSLQDDMLDIVKDRK